MGNNSSRISIFLNVFNVHVNRIPLTSRVKKVIYKKGNFIAAYDHKASDENERTNILFSADNFNFRVLQIAGLIARRIHCYAEVDKEMNSVKTDIGHNNELIEEENKKLQPLRDKKIENISTLQKINLEIKNLNEEEKRVKDLSIKLLNNIKVIQSDHEREKSISLDASLNEKRILEEKNELLKTEKQLFDIEKKSEIDLDVSKSDLKDQQIKLDSFLGKKLDSIDFKGQLKILKEFEEINSLTIQNLKESNIDEANRNLNKLNE